MERKVTDIFQTEIDDTTDKRECWRTHPGQWYSLRVEGRLDATWGAWFDGMALTQEPNGDTTIVGIVPDQCALHGLLVKVRDMHLTLVSVQRL
jgi:hypothetical protein